MEETQKTELLATLKKVLNETPNAWEQIREVAGTILDCTEFVLENKSVVFSRGLLGSSREIENILREKNPDLLSDFREMASIVEEIKEIWATRSRGIDTAILVSSGFLLELQDREEKEQND